MSIIIPQVGLKLPSLAPNIAQLKNSHFLKSVPSFKNIVKKLKIPIF
jgi:hypothetical protein